LREDLEVFMDYLEHEKGLSRNTLESYARDLQQYIEFLEQQNIRTLGETSKVHVVSYIARLSSSAGLRRPSPGRLFRSVPCTVT